MSPTEKKLIEMLTENTGSRFLDSGCVYGRHWERNQTRDFLHEPEFTLDVVADEDGNVHEIGLTRNLFSFLKNHLVYSKQAQSYQKQFEKLASSWAFAQESWDRCIDEFLNRNPSWEEYNNGYTYKHTNFLSQNIVWYFLHIPYDRYFVLLQIHNGCDARSGFTKPVFFEMKAQWWMFFDFNRAYAICKGERKQERAGKTALFDLPKTYCKLCWKTKNSGYTWECNEASFNEIGFYNCLKYNKEKDQLFCKRCGGEITLM